MKNKEQGITLVALVITIIILIILATVAINFAFGDNGLIQRAEDARDYYANDTSYTDESITNVESYLDEIINGVGSGSNETLEPIPRPEKNGVDFSRTYGKIDILFLEGISYNVGNANTPVIDKENMIPVNWDGNYWIVTTEDNWDFKYGTTDETKKWANVMLRDTLEVEGIEDAKTATIEEMNGKKVIAEGSMLVWIPRYAYKITYYDDSMTTVVGYSDARGIVDAEGKTPSNITNDPITSIAVADYYRPHPAFEDGSKTGFTQGEWDKNIKGFWIGKSATTEKVNGKVTIHPNKYTYEASIETAYDEAQKLGIANSHMAKNSEWGAMAYLAESIYGRNGVEAELRNQGITQLEDYKTFLEASTTGNIYGIYHSNGGSYNYTAAYIPDNSTYNGNSFTSVNNTTNNKTESTKYATVYQMVNADASSEENYNYNINRIFGDGIIETSENNNSPWHAEPYAGFVGKGTLPGPFFYRSGCPVSSGKFLFSAYNGDNLNDGCGFTICCITE